VVLIHGWPLSDEMYEYQYNDLRKDLSEISIPTVIMHGKKDKICSFDLAEQMQAGISNSHIIPFDNSGHSLFLEETKKINDELIRFATATRE
jgi:non-heme chloroperoxidase